MKLISFIVLILCFVCESSFSQIEFSHPSGFFYDEFELTIETPNPGAIIWYTLDGSNPLSSSSVLIDQSPLKLQINPNSTDSRPKTPAVLVRVIEKQMDIPNYPITRTYIFPKSVIEQTHPGGEWPEVNMTNENEQFIDFDMDPDVVEAPSYKDLIIPALIDIPSLSIVTPIENLFSEDDGIYVNAKNEGYEWERECSFELINPDNSPGFMVNAGLRIRGGHSRYNLAPKHSFRLFFRQDYGDKKLNFPLFGEEGADEFDHIDLRCSQNYSWARRSFQNQNTFIREVFTRDSQRDANQPHTRSMYYHLYLNGMYWGLYQTQERSEASFASTTKYCKPDSVSFTPSLLRFFSRKSSPILRLFPADPRLLFLFSRFAIARYLQQGTRLTENNYLKAINS